MIVGLGNTLTDVTDEISQGDYVSIPGSVISGIMNNDGFAIVIGLGVLYVGYKIFQGSNKSVKAIRKIPSNVRDKRKKQHNEQIGRKVKELRAQMI